MTSNNAVFDFEYMTKLAKDDPDAFARCREALIGQLFAGATQSQDLANLQLYLDATRYSLPQGIASSERMVGMMIESMELTALALVELDALLQDALSKGKA